MHLSGRLRLLTSLAAALAAAAPVRAALPRDVRAWAEAYARPALRGSGIEAAGRRLAFGHLDLDLQSGRLFPVLVEDQVAGVFFLGSGRFAYVSSDPIEAATYH